MKHTGAVLKADICENTVQSNKACSDVNQERLFGSGSPAEVRIEIIPMNPDIVFPRIVTFGSRRPQADHLLPLKEHYRLSV